MPGTLFDGRRLLRSGEGVGVSWTRVKGRAKTAFSDAVEFACMGGMVCMNVGFCLVHKSAYALCVVYKRGRGCCINIIMWLCKGGAHPQYRVQMDSGTFYPSSELVRKCKNLTWPCTHVFLEYFPGSYLKVQGETELAFACELVPRYHTSVTSASN
eukprot:3639671-Rhodomonas_salina.1